MEIKHVICFSANRIRGANGGRFIELTEGNDFRLRNSTAYYNNTSPYNRVENLLGAASSSSSSSSSRSDLPIYTYKPNTSSSLSKGNNSTGGAIYTRGGLRQSLSGPRIKILIRCIRFNTRMTIMRFGGNIR